MAVIVFVQARPKVTAIVPGQMLSKVTGAVIPTRLITYPVKNGSAAEVNQ